MDISPAIELIKKYEGCRLKAYKCPAGKWTIGWGETWHQEANRAVQEKDRITQEQADRWLKTRVGKFLSEVQALAKIGTDNQICALVSFAYNFGTSKLAVSTLLQLHRAGEYEKAAEEFMKWTKAGGKVLNGLVSRRNDERLLYLKGIAHD